MNLTWNLTYLFKNNDEFYEEIKRVNKMVLSINKNITLNENSLLELLNKKWEIKELANNILVYGNLMYYKDIKSKECIKLKKDAEEFNNEIDNALKFIDIYIYLNCEIRNRIIK